MKELLKKVRTEYHLTCQFVNIDKNKWIPEHGLVTGSIEKMQEEIEKDGWKLFNEKCYCAEHIPQES